MDPSLTVAICTKERPVDLGDCLSSVLVDQRVSEVLVSNDGLDLETDSVINRFVAKDAPRAVLAWAPYRTRREP